MSTEYLTFLAPEVLHIIFGHLTATDEDVCTIEDGASRGPLTGLEGTCTILRDEVREWVFLEQWRRSEEVKAKRAAAAEKARAQKAELDELFYEYRMKFEFMTKYGSTGWESRGDEPVLAWVSPPPTPKSARKHKAKSLSIDSTAANEGAPFKPIEKKKKAAPPAVRSPPTTPSKKKEGTVLPPPSPEAMNALLEDLFGLVTPTPSEGDDRETMLGRRTACSRG